MLGATAVVLAHAATIKALEKGEEDGHMTRSYLTPCFGVSNGQDSTARGAGRHEGSHAHDTGIHSLGGVTHRNLCLAGATVWWARTAAASRRC